MSSTAQLIKKKAKKKMELKGENDLFVLSRKELYELTGSIEDRWAYSFHSAIKNWLKKLRRVVEVPFLMTFGFDEKVYEQVRVFVEKKND